MRRQLDQAEQALVTAMAILLTLSAVAVLALGTLMIVNLNEAERSQGTHFYVGVAMVLLLGVIAGKFADVRKRRRR